MVPPTCRREIFTSCFNCISKMLSAAALFKTGEIASSIEVFRTARSLTVDSKWVLKPVISCAAFDSQQIVLKASVVAAALRVDLWFSYSELFIFKGFYLYHKNNHLRRAILSFPWLRVPLDLRCMSSFSSPGSNLGFSWSRAFLVTWSLGEVHVP